MSLQAEHIRWIITQLDSRTVPALPGAQLEQIMTAQSIVKRELANELAALEMPAEVPQKAELKAVPEPEDDGASAEAAQ